MARIAAAAPGTAFARLARGGIDAVLLVMSLAARRGFNTFTDLRAVTPHVPFLFLSDSRDERHGLEAVRAGAQDFLVRNEVDGPQLARALRLSIERNRLHAALLDMALVLGVEFMPCQMTMDMMGLTKDDLIDGIENEQHLPAAKQVVERSFLACAPELVINTASMTDVDACERDPEMAWRENVVVTRNVAEAAERGWTSISEQWVDQERIAELEGLATNNALPLRVDAYLALNALEVGGYYGDWYVDRKPGLVSDHLRVPGLKIHLDSGSGAILYWDAAELTATIGRADASGWQVSVHSVSKEAQEMVLDAFEAAIGPVGPNPLHHRIEHALQVTDEQLARMVAMDLVPVIQLDAGGAEWVIWAGSDAAEQTEGQRRDYLAEDTGWLARWRDFVEAGLHVAASSDAPWFLPDLVPEDDFGRPVDQIVGGMTAHPRVFEDVPAWAFDQLLTAEQGLRAVTLDAAWALGDETRRGHLDVGTLGDVTILSGDVTTATAEEIRAFDVIATIVGGVVVYCSDPLVCGT